jgi:hypothetical protein
LSPIYAGDIEILGVAAYLHARGQFCSGNFLPACVKLLRPGFLAANGLLSALKMSL